jgi:hypothetical protein
MRLKQQQMAATASKGKSVKEEAPWRKWLAGAQACRQEHCEEKWESRQENSNYSEGR